MNSFIKKLAYIGMSKDVIKLYEWSLNNPDKSSVNSERRLSERATAIAALFTAILSLLISLLLFLLLR